MVAYVSLFWPYLPLMLAHVTPMTVYVGAMRPPYIGPISPLRWPMLALCIGPISPLCWPMFPMVAYVSLFWPYLLLMLAQVDPMRTYVGAMRPQVGSIYVGSRLGLSMLSLRSYFGPISP